MIMIITTTIAAITHVDMPLLGAGVAVTSGLIDVVGVGVAVVVGG